MAVTAGTDLGRDHEGSRREHVFLYSRHREPRSAYADHMGHCPNFTDAKGSFDASAQFEAGYRNEWRGRAAWFGNELVYAAAWRRQRCCRATIAHSAGARSVARRTRMGLSELMAKLKIKPKTGCIWDLVSLGEVMLRLDPGDERISTTRSFRVWEGGGEYNVARGLRRCFGMRTSIVTALADNPAGRLLEDLMLQGGVDLSHLRWVEYDGIGREARNGIYFLERGFGVRGAMGMMDRGNTPISQLQPGQVDWDGIFAGEGVRWFHTGGVMCALSAQSPAVAREAMIAAKRQGVVVSFDCNYRPSLWKNAGGRQAACDVNRTLAPYIDVLFGHEGDLAAVLCEASHAAP